MKPWPVVGHEPDGSHPVLIMGRGASRGGRDILVVPTTSQGKERENLWEVNIEGTDSCALVDGLRTVAVSDLRRPRPVLAFLEDLEQVRFALRWLLGNEPVSKKKFVRGSVYHLSDSKGLGRADRVLTLHYNYRNDMAMVMQVDASSPGSERLAVPILSCPALVGSSFLPTCVWAVSAEDRLGGCLGTISASELRRAHDLLLEVVGPSTVAASA